MTLQGGGAFTNQVQTEWMCYNCFFMVHEWIKGSLRWHEEQFYTVGPVLWNDAGGLADGKLWVSMPLSRNGFTMLIRLTFLAFGLSTNVSLMLLISWLLALYAQSTL